jgi:hypothetical protein
MECCFDLKKSRKLCLIWDAVIGKWNGLDGGGGHELSERGAAQWRPDRCRVASRGRWMSGGVGSDIKPRLRRGASGVNVWR